MRWRLFFQIVALLLVAGIIFYFARPKYYFFTMGSGGILGWSSFMPNLIATLSGVLVGVFLAFRLNSWREWRRILQRSADSIQALLEEIQRNASDLGLAGQQLRGEAEGGIQFPTFLPITITFEAVWPLLLQLPTRLWDGPDNRQRVYFLYHEYYHIRGRLSDLLALRRTGAAGSGDIEGTQSLIGQLWTEQYQACAIQELEHLGERLLERLNRWKIRHLGK